METKQDVLQNMILFNDVPSSFLEEFSREITSGTKIVPEPCKAKVLKQIKHAINGNDKVLRFHVMLTALTHSEAIRAKFLSGCNDAQVNEWLQNVLPREWELFLMGSNGDGQPRCGHIREAKYAGVLDFVSKLQSEYISMGWKEPVP